VGLLAVYLALTGRRNPVPESAAPAQGAESVAG
jgi:hypothetical protein